MTLQIRQGKIVRTLPVVVWLLASMAVGYLFVHQAERTELTGIVYSQEQIINSQESGYVRYLPVNLFQTVKKGDTLAIIKETSVAREQYNNDFVQAQRATAEAELFSLQAQLRAAEEELHNQKFDTKNNIASISHQIAIDVEKARLEVLKIRSTLEPAKLQLKDYEVEIEIVTYLLKNEAAEQYELERAQSQYNILQEQISRDEELLVAAEKMVEIAMIRKEEFNEQQGIGYLVSDKQLEPIRAAIVAQELRIKELMEVFDTVVLTAPFDGIVNTLNFKPGQAIMSGEPIMTIVKPNPDYIVAWVPHYDINNFELNAPVRVFSQRIPIISFESQISHTNASIELMPENLWLNQTTPTWGRKIQIPVMPGFSCLHNEIVGIKRL